MKKVLIIGGGEAGEMVVREILNHPELGYQIVGLIDDDPHKIGKLIYGKKILGNRNDIIKVVKKRRVDEIIISIPSAKGDVIRSIIAHCEKAKCNFRIVPGIYEIISGDVSIQQIREIKPEDLLGRETVKIDLNEVSSYLKGKRILITGAGGSIGGELSRQVARFALHSLILLDHDENGLYYIDIELKRKYPNLPLALIIGDIKDRCRMDQVFQRFKPDLVFHAAAHKHVPLMEENPEEAVKNNILGTLNLMEVSTKYNVEKFILISTDKVVNPTSVMGVTKRIAELLMQIYENKTVFLAVRFGNVLGSEGSVVPIFMKQISLGGPVTVTHPNASRYFMTGSEAAQLVIQTSILGEKQGIFILNMGEPIKIYDLARNLITLSGFEVGKDIKIEFIGLRPGEKLEEELLSEKEEVSTTSHSQILRAKQDTIDKDKLKKDIKDLVCLAEKGERRQIINKLKEIVPDYRPQMEDKN